MVRYPYNQGTNGIGHRTAMTDISGTQRLTYTQGWDAENRLKTVTNTATTPNRISKFIYDGDGARVLQVQITATQRITKTYYSG